MEDNIPKMSLIYDLFIWLKKMEDSGSGKITDINITRDGSGKPTRAEFKTTIIQDPYFYNDEAKDNI